MLYGKRGDVWVSAVLYLALGMIIIGIVLAAGVPLINKLKDRNTMAQTKELLISIDSNIRQVATDGPGSKRDLSPLSIDEGELIIDVDNDKILWKIKTKNKFAEPGIEFEEGVVTLLLEETAIKEEYLLTLSLSFANIADLQLDSQYGNPFKGTYRLMIKHPGEFNLERNLPKVTLKII